MMKVLALCTSHNRARKTLASLSELISQAASMAIELRVVLVDDGSTDATVETISSALPQVEILNGDGQLYWAGGMRFGWESSVNRHAFDALLVFNDDIQLEPDALPRLILGYAEVYQSSEKKLLVAGAFTDETGRDITYGGYVKCGRLNPLKLVPMMTSLWIEAADTTNMNFVIISREALEDIGFLAKYFVHSGADIEFGHRLKKVGGTVWVLRDPVGVCNRNGNFGTWREDGISRLERLKRYAGPKAHPPTQRFNFCKSHGGPFWPFIWIYPYIRILVFSK